MTRRKPHNMRARMGRVLGAILRSNAVAVVNLDPSGRLVGMTKGGKHFAPVAA